MKQLMSTPLKSTVVFLFGYILRNKLYITYHYLAGTDLSNPGFLIQG
jgi:hypothetical protein